MVPLIIIGSLILFLLLFAVVFGFIAFYKSFTRKTYPGDNGIESAVVKVGKRPYSEDIVKGIYWFRDFNDKEEIYIKSTDGLRLKGYYFKNPKSQGRVVILAHGYRSFPYFDFSASAKEYFNRGFDLLFIVQRSHGDSDGKLISFGIKERYDLLSWINYIDTRHNGKAKILLSGVSMGSATVMYTLGLDLPESVKAAVCDCGYDSPRGVIAFALIQVFKSKWLANLMSYFVSFASFCITGHFLGCVSGKKALKNCTVPVMFAHGKADDVVPFEMSESNFSHPKGYKAFVISDKAAHALTFMYENEKYLAELDKLIEHSGL